MSVCLWARQLCGRGLVSGCCCCCCWCKVPAKAWALGVAVCTCRLLFAPGQGQKHNKLRENALRCNGLWGGGRGGVRCGECGTACGRSTLENLLFMNAVPPPNSLPLPTPTHKNCTQFEEPPTSTPTPATKTFGQKKCEEKMEEWHCERNLIRLRDTLYRDYDERPL